jgi:threonine dehydrogenase-like Zn-dependent dehydrogenase
MAARSGHIVPIVTKVDFELKAQEMLLSDRVQSPAALLGNTIANRSATVGVIGLGYVGLPLVAAVARAGFRAVGFDIDPAKIALLNSGKSYIDGVHNDQVAEHVRANRFRATSEFFLLRKSLWNSVLRHWYPAATTACCGSACASPR